MCRNFLVRLAVLVAQPEAGVMGDVELAVGVGRQAVAAGVVVRSRAEDGGVVLGDVEVDRPGPQRRGQGLQCLVERLLVLPVEVAGQDPILGGVLAQRVEQGVGHVGLEADRLGLADPLEQVDHRPPGVHAAPADLALGGQLLAVIARDGAGLPERLGDLLLVARGIGEPVVRAAGRVDPDHAVGPRTQLAQAAWRSGSPCGPARGTSCGLRPRPWPSRRRSAPTPGRRPSRSPAPAKSPCRPGL